MYFLPYNKNLKDFSRYLRTHSTMGEILLWNEVKQNKLCGYTFYRQKPIDRYIVDFYCKPLNLVIEIDGAVHLDEAVKLNDEERQAVLEKYNLHFLRFDDDDLRVDLGWVLQEIESWIMAKTQGELYIRNIKRK